MGNEVVECGEYSLLKDFGVEIEGEGTFSLCFWVYLMNSTALPATIIQQVVTLTAHFLTLLLFLLIL